MTDIEIRNAVLAALDAATDVHASAIGVAAHRGVVTLTGRVASFAEKAAAARAAMRTVGVKGLADELDVCDEQESACADEVIAARIVDFLKATEVAGGVNARVEVDHGWVHLTGTVDHPRQRVSIGNYARLGEGVSGVENRLRLRSAAAE